MGQRESAQQPRRRFLALAGGAVTAALAGCSTGSSDSDDTPPRTESPENTGDEAEAGAPSTATGTSAAGDGSEETDDGDSSGGDSSESIEREQIAELIPENAEEDADFGHALALSGDAGETLVSAYQRTHPENPNQWDTGAVYVFGDTADGWIQRDVLVPENIGQRDGFGHSMACAGGSGTAIFGTFSGEAAYTFEKDSGEWGEQATLTPDDERASETFGEHTAISGDGSVALVSDIGADVSGEETTGAAYVFARSDGGWRGRGKLTPGSPGSYSEFGREVALSYDGRTAIVGDAADEEGAGNAGAAYVFSQSNGEWSAETKLTASDPASRDYFGATVALSDDGETAFVGAYGKGAVYVYERADGGWDEHAKLGPNDNEQATLGDSLAVSADGELVMAGAANRDNAAVYEFHRDGDEWTQNAKIDSVSSEYFGSDVSMVAEGDRFLFGARLADTSHGEDTGAAYIFE